MLNEKIQEKIKNNLPIKLHLGCGPVMLDGYINVDGSQATPEVCVQDITGTFPIPDNTVDEIISIHVIEHISRKDIPKMFKEWLRILKPGGRVVTEWPDTLKACREIVNNPKILTSKDRKDMKRTLFVFFYDDLKYDHPSMIHRWGYSVESLGQTFVENGFSEWTSEANQFAKSPNDSRIVAMK